MTRNSLAKQLTPKYLPTSQKTRVINKVFKKLGNIKQRRMLYFLLTHGCLCMSRPVSWRGEERGEATLVTFLSNTAHSGRYLGGVEARLGRDANWSLFSCLEIMLVMIITRW